MVELEFVGEKPVINASGVSFDMRKHDKYQFIEPAAQILKIFLKLGAGSNVERISPKDTLANEEILKILYEVRPDFEKRHDEFISDYERYLEDEISSVKTQDNLTNEEKQTLLKNYEYMKHYRVQRQTNKIVYEELVKACTNAIESKKIQELKAPFSSTFLHVLTSLKTALENNKKVSKVALEVELKDESPYSKLSVKF
ncbi:MAG: hypothetical protein ACTTIC_01785 [Helicobacteraceae bacterium]